MKTYDDATTTYDDTTTPYDGGGGPIPQTTATLIPAAGGGDTGQGGRPNRAGVSALKRKRAELAAAILLAME